MSFFYLNMNMTVSAGNRLSVDYVFGGFGKHYVSAGPLSGSTAPFLFFLERLLISA